MIHLPKKEKKKPGPKTNKQHIRIGIAVPDYLLDELEKIEQTNLNFSEEFIKVINRWDKDPFGLIKKYNIQPFTGRTFKQKTIYINEENIAVYNRILEKFKQFVVSFSSVHKLKLADIIITVMYQDRNF